MPSGPVIGPAPCPNFAVPLVQNKQGLANVGWYRFFSRLGVFAPTSSVFADLPTSPQPGELRTITDSNTVVWGANVAGGGANNVLARWNLTHWTVVGI